MSEALINNKKVYYEVYGEGEPLVVLNGIMMSTMSWKSFTDVLSENHKLILVDFIDQGKTEKAKEYYTQDIQVELLRGLFEHLNFDKVHLLGVSYGGEVAIKFALKYQEKLYSLTLSNTTSYTNHMLKDIGESWIYATKTYDGPTFFKTTIPTIYSSQFYEENIEWLRKREKLFTKLFTQEWYDAFIRLVRSAESLNVTDELYKIKIPTLIIGSEFDIITPIRFQEEINKRIENSKFVIIKNAGHASMYEKPYEFTSIVLGFLKTYDKKFNIG